MATHHFIIKYKGRLYECFLNEELYVYVLNENADVIGKSKFQSIQTLEDAQEVAKEIIKSPRLE